MATNYPFVPGHEIIGRVIRVGSAVARFRPGDFAGVGCSLDPQADSHGSDTL